MQLLIIRIFPRNNIKPIRKMQSVKGISMNWQVILSNLHWTHSLDDLTLVRRFWELGEVVFKKRAIKIITRILIYPLTFGCP